MKYLNTKLLPSVESLPVETEVDTSHDAMVEHQSDITELAAHVVAHAESGEFLLDPEDIVAANSAAVSEVVEGVISQEDLSRFSVSLEAGWLKAAAEGIKTFIIEMIRKITVFVKRLFGGIEALKKRVKSLAADAAAAKHPTTTKTIKVPRASLFTKNGVLTTNSVMGTLSDGPKSLTRVYLYVAHALNSLDGNAYVVDTKDLNDTKWPGGYIFKDRHSDHVGKNIKFAKLSVDYDYKYNGDGVILSLSKSDCEALCRNIADLLDSIAKKNSEFESTVLKIKHTVVDKLNPGERVQSETNKRALMSAGVALFSSFTSLAFSVCTSAANVVDHSVKHLNSDDGQ